MASRLPALAVLIACVACEGAGVPGADGGAALATSVFDLTADTTTPETFFDLPFPSDLRLRSDGTPDLTGYPTARVSVVESVRRIAEDRVGWPVIPVAYFRFTRPLTPRSPTDLIEPALTAPLLLLDIDPRSPDRGTLVPCVASTVPADRYAVEHLLAVAPYPGWILRSRRTYAVVVTDAVGTASGAPLVAPDALSQLARGETPNGARAEAAAPLYRTLFETLDSLGLDRGSVIAATVFTTGDEVERLRSLTDALLDRHTVSIEGLVLDPDDGDHPGYCELIGTVSQPQFQAGIPPFDTEGLFELDADGLPAEQRRESTPIVITLPKLPMPTAGFPLMVYFHGSGGVAAQLVDRGPRPERGSTAPGTGPAAMIAEHGFAAVGAALPLSPDRLPGASETAYLNFTNLAAFRDTFRQGVIEQRLLIRALSELEIDPAVLAACSGPELPPDADAFRFDGTAFAALGQSMGGMYTNLIGAVEPRLGALVPTGAGGFWSYFILETTLIENLRDLLGALLRTDGETLDHLHPALSLLELGWEAAEPLVFMPRLSRRPLDGVQPRPIYEPVGEGDSYFPPRLYDAVALAYGHPQAGENVWSSMQDSLALSGLDGVLPLPVWQNARGEDGTPYTGVVVQSAGDGYSDPHAIFVQVPEIRHQWGCFLESWYRTGVAVVPPLEAPGTACANAP